MKTEIGPLLDKKAEKLFQEAMYKRREEQKTHLPYATELRILKCIKNGDVPTLAALKPEQFSQYYRVLSEDRYRQAMYEFVAAVTLFTRYAVEGGLDNDIAYDISDTYIRLADKTKRQEEILPLYGKVLMDFAQRVRKIRDEGNAFSPKIQACVEYIESNLHDNVSLDDLAREVGCNPTYLCAKFKAETGMTITQYSYRVKVESAKQLLTGGNAPIATIATILGFCSQAYFTKTFRRFTGETPRLFRIKYSRTSEP